jgi:hypothetical protein
MKSVQKLEDNPLVQCSVRAHGNADMMRPLDRGFACDACHDLLFKTGVVTAEAFALSQGAPADVLERAQLLDETIAAREEETAARLAGTASELRSQVPA